MAFDAASYDQLARSSCFVCRIVEGRPLVPDPEILYEDASHIAFLNQFPTQAGYCLVCPKRHVERFESELTTQEWIDLQALVQTVSRAVAEATDAIRLYIASLGSPERNAHLHIHICPCPPGTPFTQQQFEAMSVKTSLNLTSQQMSEVADRIKGGLDLTETLGSQLCLT